MPATGISILAFLMAGILVLAVGRAAGPRQAATITLVAVTLLILEHRLAAAGVLARWDRRPPPFMAMVLGVLLLCAALVYSKTGDRMIERLPAWMIVASQAFRLPLELTMHRAYEDGLMPVQMSYSGYNFDIFTGTTAIIVAALAWRNHTRAVWLWNLAGSILLVNIVAIAVASTPVFRAFGPDRLNTWVANPPYVWLPGILVPAAFTGHLLLWRKILRPQAA